MFQISFIAQLGVCGCPKGDELRLKRRPKSPLSRLSVTCLPIDELPLQARAPVVAARRSVATCHAMAGNEYGYGVPVNGRRHRVHLRGEAQPVGHLLVAHRGGVGNAAQLPPHLLLKLSTLGAERYLLPQGRGGEGSRRREYQTLHLPRHAVALRDGSVDSPAGAQLVDDAMAVEAQELQVADALGVARHKDGAEGRLGKAKCYRFHLLLIFAQRYKIIE